MLLLDNFFFLLFLYAEMIYEQFLRLMLFATVYNENPRNTKADRKCFCGK